MRAFSVILSLAAIAMAAAVPSTGAEAATQDCRKDRLRAGESCEVILGRNNLTIEQFRQMNPKINEGCTNAWANYDYCVGR